MEMELTNCMDCYDYHKWFDGYLFQKKEMDLTKTID